VIVISTADDWSNAKNKVKLLKMEMPHRCRQCLLPLILWVAQRERKCFYCTRKEQVLEI